MSAEYSIAPYRKILAPYDGSEMSDHALKHASYMARTTGAEVVIMHVMELDSIPPTAFLPHIRPGDELIDVKEKFYADFEVATRRMLERKVTDMNLGPSKVSYKLREGKPSDAIVSEADAGGYDLIVMASSRITSSIKLLGSNARRTIDSTSKPVLLIHE